MNEELMFVIKKARMGFGKFHPQHTQNKAIINTKTKYSNHIILGIALSRNNRYRNFHVIHDLSTLNALI